MENYLKEVSEIRVVNEGNRFIPALKQCLGLSDRINLEYNIEQGYLESKDFQKLFNTSRVYYELESIPYLNNTDIRIFDLEYGETFDILKLKICSDDKKISFLLRSELNKDIKFLKREPINSNCYKELLEMCCGIKMYNLERLVKEKVDINSSYKKVVWMNNVYETFITNSFVLEVTVNDNNEKYYYFSGTKHNNNTILSEVFDVNNIIENILDLYILNIDN